MEIRVLKYFLVVAREENITKAANLLHMTQPTLSRQLMNLEEVLGCKLFERGKTKITLTPDGLLLKRRAQEIVELEKITKQELASQKDVLKGVIHIGAGETKSMELFAEIIADFKAKYPNVTYQLYSGNADDIKDKIDKGLIDIALLLEPVKVEKYDYIRFPNNECWGMITTKDASIASKEFIKPEDLVDIPLLLPSRDIVRSQIKDWAGPYYEQLNVTGTFNLLYNACKLAEVGVGNIITVDSIVNVTGESNLNFIPLSPNFETGVMIVMKKNQVSSKTVTTFINHIRKYLENIK